MARRKKTVRISEAEWNVMEVLWTNSESADPQSALAEGLTLGEIVKMLGEKFAWTSTTIRTLLIRLADKGAVKVDKTTGVYKYSPAYPRSECITEEVNSFVSRIFNNSSYQLVASLVKEGKLSNEERKEIMEMLKDTEE